MQGETGELPDLRPIQRRVRQRIATTVRRSAVWQVVLGTVGALMAVAVRYALPLEPDQLPTVGVVVMLAMVTAFVGLPAGIVTAVLGGLLSWYLFFNPWSWSLTHAAWLSLLGYAVEATVIIATASLYRTSERLHHRRDLTQLREQAQTAELFARELAHRLGNTLAIVQSVAAQTVSKGTRQGREFAERLNALAAANYLLTEDVAAPSADVGDVIRVALKPFLDDRSDRLVLTSVDAQLPAQQVLILSMAVHELATNAAKYGALSLPSGSVALTVEECRDGLRLVWKERGGPPLAVPQREGFGTKLLRRTGTATHLEFEPDGLRCTIEIAHSRRNGAAAHPPAETFGADGV